MKRWLAAATFVAALAAAAPAWASFPGSNGRIVFQSNRDAGSLELYSMNPDATDVRRLTWNSVPDRLPRFSPDGSRIVFARAVAGVDQDIWIMNADGSDERQLTSGPARDDAPVFTRDGEHVVFQRVAGPVACPCELRIVGADGEGERLLDTGPGNAVNADVSATGRLAFASDRDGTLSIYVGDLRGGPVRRVTEGPAAFGDFRPRWSPRGNDLVFMRDDGTSFNDIYTVHASGAGLRQLTSGPRFEEQPQWSPDGERILFAVFDVGAPFGARLHTIDADDGSDDRLLPQAAEIADSFDHDGLDGSKWWESFHGTGSGLAVTGGRAETSLAADATDGPSGFMGPGFGSQCHAVGDYDARVRYELLDWPFSNGVHVLLGDAGTTGSIGRRSESGFEDYLAFFNPVPASALTTHVAGELRLERSGSSLTAYYREGDAWVPLLTGPTTAAPALLNVHLFSNDAIFGNQFVRVAYDDFRITADDFECPSWWRDAGPDWAVAGTAAGEPVTWDAFADFRRSPLQANPTGVWSYLWSDGLAHDPARYHLLPHYSVVDGNREQWDDTASVNLLVGHLGGEGSPLFHSFGGAVAGYGRNAILGWTSPVSGHVTAVGEVRLPSLSRCGLGSGIVWSIDRGAETLRSLVLPAGGAASFEVKLHVRQGETLYFVHDPGFDSSCDSALVDVRVEAAAAG